MGSHAERVSKLQTELLADDLEPPRASVAWSDLKLRSWFEGGGELQQEQNKAQPFSTSLFNALDAKLAIFFYLPG